MAETLNFTLTAQDKTQAAFNAVSKSMMGLNNAALKLKSALAIIGVGSVFASIGNSIKGAVDRASQLEEAMQKTGASSEFLTTMMYAAKLSGVEFESLEKGLTKLSKSMDAASSDAKSGIAYDFKRLGINARESNGDLRSTEEVFKDLADRFAEIPDGARKAALAQAVFGKAGADLIPILNEGRKGIEEFSKQADLMGIKFASDTGKQLEKFGDEMDKLGFLGQGFANIFATNVMGAISIFFAKIGETNDATKTAENRFSNIQSIAQGLATVFRYLAAAIYVVGSAFIEVARDANAAFEALGTAIMGSFEDAAKRLSERATEQVSFMTILKNAQDILNNSTSELTVTRDKATKSIGDNAKATDGLIDKYRALIDPGYEVLKQMKEFEQLANKGAFTSEEFAIGMDRLRQKLIDARAETDPMAMAIKGLQGNIQTFADNAASAMAEFTMSGKLDFKSMVSSMIKDLLTLFYKMTIFQPIANAMKTALSGASTGGGGGLFGDLFSGFGDWIGGFFKATGGPVMANSPYIVGERGPELFVPGGNGTIIPNNNLGMGGGENLVINQTINVSTGVQATVRAEIQSLMPQIATATKSAVLEARRRGGSFATAFGG